MADDSEVSLAAGDLDVSSQALPKPKLNKEFGVGSAMPFSVPYSGPGAEKAGLFEYLRPLEEDGGPSLAQLEVMRRSDGQARALFRLITEPIRAALKTSTFVPVDGGDKEAQFANDLLMTPASNGGMSIPFSRVIAQLLLAVFDGFSAFELVYTQPKVGPLKGKYALAKLAYRPATTVTFLTDEHGSFAGLRQRAFFQGRTIDERIEPDSCVYYAACEEERPFYGVSYFQTAFYHYDKKMKLYYIAHLAAQRAATGLRKGRMPSNASVQDSNAFMSAMADLGIAQYITLPGTAQDGWEVEILRDASPFDYLAYINHQNSQMSKSILAQWFDQSQGQGLGEGGAVNTPGLGQSSDTMFVAMLKAIMAEIATLLDVELVPRFIDWNFNTGKYPTFQWGTFTDEQSAEIAATFNALATSGPSMNASKEFFLALEQDQAQKMGLEIDYKPIIERTENGIDIATQLQESQLQSMQAMSAPPDQGAPDGSGGQADGGGQGGGGQGSGNGDQNVSASAPATLDGLLSSAKAGRGVPLTVAWDGSLDPEDRLIHLARELLDEAVRVPTL